MNNQVTSHRAAFAPIWYRSNPRLRQAIFAGAIAALYSGTLFGGEGPSGLDLPSFGGAHEATPGVSSKPDDQGNVPPTRPSRGSGAGGSGGNHFRPYFCSGDVRFINWVGMDVLYRVQIYDDDFHRISFSDAAHVDCDYDIVDVFPGPNGVEQITARITCQPIGTAGIDHITVTAHSTSGETAEMILTIESYTIDAWHVLERPLGTTAWHPPLDGDVRWAMDDHTWEVQTTPPGALDVDPDASPIRWYHLPYGIYDTSPPTFLKNLDNWNQGIPGLGYHMVFPRLEFQPPGQIPKSWGGHGPK